MKFKHKGLQALFEKGDSRRVAADLVQRVRHTFYCCWTPLSRLPASIRALDSASTGLRGTGWRNGA